MYLPMQSAIIITLLLIFIHSEVNALISHNPQISYFDGPNYIDSCRSKLERKISGLSGLLISHQLYGSRPYNASKNCFLLITAPVGYRIRLRVLEFNVLGDPQNCDKDTLHVFDHEKTIDPQEMKEASLEEASPGPILGQFCGLIRNASELAVSTENALTLWWHSDADLPFNHNGEGFRLLWSAFRKSDSAPCHAQREFTCNNQECIPAELACNRYPDCKDESDQLRQRQIDLQCDAFDSDPLSSLTGLNILLICMAIVGSIVCLCICSCVCCKCMKPPDKPMTNNMGQTRSSLIAEHPLPPGFYPPSPPKANLLETRLLRSSEPNEMGSANINCLLMENHYTRQQAANQPQPRSNAGLIDKHQIANSDYTYVRNDTKQLLI